MYSYSFSIYALCISVFLLVSPSIVAQHNGPGSSKRKGRVNGRSINIHPRDVLNNDECVDNHFRTYDGTCNNISDSSRMEYGATDIMLNRELSAIYGSLDPFNAMGGENRRSPRDISNIVSDQTTILYSARNLSALVYNWGQFIDHDITLTPESELEYEPIPLPQNEPLFTVDIPFVRSEHLDGTGDDEPREQLNIITAWMDASMIYGSDSTRADWLRSHQQGKLRVSSGDLLPFNTTDGEYGSPIDTTAPSMAGADSNGKMWVAGDVRAGEQTGLTCLHTLFVREHNRICDELVASGMNLDEAIYQRARKRVIALIQKITYKEFLPALGVDLPRYRGYDPQVRPDIHNLFATAAYRLGHTMVLDSIQMLNNSCSPTADSIVSLVEAFFNPEIIQAHGIASFLKGLTVEVQAEVDPYIVGELRNFLFSDPTQSPIVAGLDLVALNLQRGRDHGLPDYNTIRAHYLGASATDFTDISSNLDISTQLSQAYNGDINEIDAWMGMLSEDHVSGTSLGPTLHAIMNDQFSRLRDGDRFYYVRDLSRKDLSDIQETSLADVIMRNTDLTGLSSNVMYATPCNVPTTSRLSRDIRLFPNPSEGRFQVESRKRNLRLLTYSIVDIHGITLIPSTPYSRRMDLTSLQSGTYFMVFTTNKGQAMKTVILDQ